MNPSAPPRRHDLDWLRVLAIVLLVFFHSAMPYVAEWDWHLKNPQTSNLLLELNFFMSRWRMALLFLISGVGTAYALGSRRPRQFAGERSRRLLVPLIFGMLVIVPPQIYFERLAAGEASSYLSFWPSVLQLQPYPDGNTSWHHLWFIAYLAIYTAVAMPLLLSLRGERRRRLSAALARLVRRVGLMPLALPLGAALAALYPRFPGPQDVVSDLAFLCYYLIFFLYGYFLADASELWEEIERRRSGSLRWAVTCIILINALRWNGVEPHLHYTVQGAAYALLLAGNAWAWVMTFLGFGRRYLNRPSRVLTYANEGIYPFYILHQTVIVILAYYVIPLDENPIAEFLFLSVLALALTAAVYEVWIRPFDRMRVLFGMKMGRSRAAGAEVPAPATPYVAGPRSVALRGGD